MLLWCNYKVIIRGGRLGHKNMVGCSNSQQCLASQFQHDSLPCSVSTDCNIKYVEI